MKKAAEDLACDVGTCAVISSYWKLFQDSDWPTWLYGSDYISTCWFSMLLTVLHTMLLRFHVDGDFLNNGIRKNSVYKNTSVRVDMALERSLPKMILSVVVCTALLF